MKGAVDWLVNGLGCSGDQSVGGTRALMPGWSVGKVEGGRRKKEEGGGFGVGQGPGSWEWRGIDGCGCGSWVVDSG